MFKFINNQENVNENSELAFHFSDRFFKICVYVHTFVLYTQMHVNSVASSRTVQSVMFCRRSVISATTLDMFTYNRVAKLWCLHIMWWYVEVKHVS